MKKVVIIGIVLTGLVCLGALGSSGSQPATTDSNAIKSVYTESKSATESKPEVVPEKVTPICDGTDVTTDCKVDNINYTTYIYHPAVAEKSHDETVTTYTKEVTGYCTLCSDGTYSPSCATGRGACSHHGGVAQWNAPVYSSVPEYSTNKIIDTPAQEAYYEKVTK